MQKASKCSKSVWIQCCYVSSFTLDERLSRWFCCNDTLNNSVLLCCARHLGFRFRAGHILCYGFDFHVCFSHVCFLRFYSESQFVISCFILKFFFCPLRLVLLCAAVLCSFPASRDYPRAFHLRLVNHVWCVKLRRHFVLLRVFPACLSSLFLPISLVTFSLKSVKRVKSSAWDSCTWFQKPCAKVLMAQVSALRPTTTVGPVWLSWQSSRPSHQKVARLTPAVVSLHTKVSISMFACRLMFWVLPFFQK